MISSKMLKIFQAVLLIFISLSLVSCYSGTIAEDPELHNEFVQKWLQRVFTDPEDASALKNLAIFYVQANDQMKAKLYLDRALAKLPGDPALHFYKGLNLEFFNEPEQAISYYSIYTITPEDDPYREMLEGRYRWIERQNAYADIKSIINSENENAAAFFADSTIAVFPLIYKGIKTDYVPLSRGFSEMISIDLAKVKNLTVLERIRIQALLDEINLVNSGLIEESTAPRAGKILRAGTIVSGDFDIRNDKDFIINMGSWETSTSKQKTWVGKSGNLKDMFIIQKELVFAFLQKSGYILTREEQESIAYIPTSNLESFLAYSRGLLSEDAGNYKEANNYFRRAVEIDPGFRSAVSKVTSTQAIGKAGGEKKNLLTDLEREDPVTKRVVENLNYQRMQSLGNNIISGFIPGQDNRNPAQEKTLLEGNKLPDPPLPPTR
jgi:tetratricopeptide (TPR) repeat protein